MRAPFLLAEGVAAVGAGVGAGVGVVAIGATANVAATSWSMTFFTGGEPAVGVPLVVQHWQILLGTCTVIGVVVGLVLASFSC